MRREIIRGTVAGIKLLINPRWYKNERAFAAALAGKIDSDLGTRELLRGGRIIECEHQKYKRVHRMRQRPDIIAHIPTEHSLAAVDRNNFAVWAIKLKATPSKAKDDFKKLDQMFRKLGYPVGIFINVANHRDMLEHYSGDYPERLFGIAAWLEDGRVRVTCRSCLDL